MDQLQLCPPTCLDTLETLHARYSADNEVVELLRTVYRQRKDWEALIRLEEERPAAQRSPEDRARLARWYFHQGRFRDASAVLEPLVAERPADVGFARLAGLSLFQLGDYKQAVPRLDVALAGLAGAEGAEVATARALIHFHEGELEQAEKALDGALRMEPEYVPAHSALVRVLTAKGDARGARAHLERSVALRSRNNARESRAIRLSALSQAASQAVQERRWDDAERIVLQQMFPEADRKLQARLYRFLGDVRKAAGRGAAAEDAFRKAEEMSRPEGQP
jgi:tetratricopeptide (TPR) repeat protein